MKKLFMETTGISPNKSVAEIQYLLAEHGASAILIDYEEGGIKAVSFKYRSDGEEIPYRIPSQWREIRELLEKRHPRQRRGRPIQKDMDYEAKKIAWRQAYRWVAAQLAFLEARQVKFEQAFLAYRLINPNETLYERLEALKFALPQIAFKGQKG